MSPVKSQADKLLCEIEEAVASRNLGQYADQSFSGKLSIRLDKVFVRPREGKRALNDLKLSFKLAKARA